MQQRVPYESVAATIISKDPDNWFRTIIINRGAKDGIQVNMPVIAFSGEEKAVVGKVIEVRQSVSRVLPIISTDLRVGVMFQKAVSRDCLPAFIKLEPCHGDYISKSASINSAMS